MRELQNNLRKTMRFFDKAERLFLDEPFWDTIHMFMGEMEYRKYSHEKMIRYLKKLLAFYELFKTEEIIANARNITAQQWLEITTMRGYYLEKMPEIAALLDELFEQKST